VVLPQAVRRVVPPIMNDLISLQKDAGLISVLGFPLDALRYAQIWASQTASFTSYVVAGLLFVLLTIPMARLVDWLSRRNGLVLSGSHL
jgi:polar amino acid transport system permease protein